MSTRLRTAGLPAVALLVALGATQADAQFIPYYGKNKVNYDNFAWRVYKSPHFEVYYYPEFEQHLARIVSYAESGYQKISSDLKHEINFPIPIILYKTHSEFEQTNLFGGFVPEGVAAFTEPSRDRMVVPIDEPPDRLQGLITHELTHVFEFDLIPRNFVHRQVPLWVDEGLADYERGLWDNLDLMSVRDAAVTDQIPKLSRFEEYGDSPNPRLVYNLGHAAFEYIAARYGKEGIRQFLYTFRKNIVGGAMEDIYQQAFRIKPEEFDEAFEKWLKERFKPFRDKQRPSDYGKDLAPDSEKSSYTQVFAFSPSPSGEVVAALSGNRAEGELDLILLSAKDGTVIENLTRGYTEKFENITYNGDTFVAGRSISFDPKGDAVAFFARKGKRRTLFLVSPLTGKILKSIPLDLDQAQAPCLLPDNRHALLAAIKDGVSDIYLLDLNSGDHKNLTQDSFFDSDPQISPDGKTVIYTRRISGHDKIYVFPLDNPAKKTQLTFGTFDDNAPTFSPDGKLVYYSSTEDDDIYNLRSLDLRTGVVKQFTDVLGGNMAPAVLTAKGPEKVAFISYFKGEYRLQTIEPGEPLKEVDQEVEVASDESIVDFQPDVVHQVVPQNKRKKHTFEKLFLEGRPPLNVGVTSGGDFFGGSQVALSDVLGDQNFLFTAMSLREFRSYEGTYLNLSGRLHWGLTGFDDTRFFYASPYGLQQGFGREGAFATQRYSGALALAQYPLDKFRRLEVSAGYLRVSEGFANTLAAEQAQQQAALLGVPLFFNNGSIVPITVSLVGETTRFREFGPLTGHTFSLSFMAAPGVGSSLSRRTVEGDVRKYIRLGQSVVFATRVRGFLSSGTNPDYFYFGGNMELRGYPYLSIVGNKGFFANAELRLPLIDLMKTPIGILGPVRGTLYAGIGGAHFKGDNYTFGTSEPGISYVKDPLFGEAVSGYHLIDGRASYGFGLQFFFLGYPLHFDWSKLTDLKVASPTRFDFWVGFDF